ncbi:hypothetical protein DEJ50_06790 [Streptomyces venezuelae]|uniref:Uncharacterized protein n=1 Tax=Streptomyces venezuelae TaxID=54571 RepID=A0A5P2CXE4_STRVZ|nr:hypothetical protein [Streptomyces venezuelae]QES47576.1 hypothetical protein DEJ50_06790 [Streptomyces venezuelae]
MTTANGTPHRLRYFFEYGVDTPLWPGPAGAPGHDDRYGPCAPERLPLTSGTRDELRRLADLYQSSLDWDDPAGPSPWSGDQEESFRHAADTVLAAVRRELGDGWTVEDRRG